MKKLSYLSLLILFLLTIGTAKAQQLQTENDRSALAAAGPADPGFIQVVVARALDIPGRNGGTCMPVVSARNLTGISINHIIVEIAYSGAAGERAYSSTVHKDMDRNEFDDRLVEPLPMRSCAGAVGIVRIPLCTLKTGVDCRNLIVASDHGSIPLKMHALPGSVGGGGATGQSPGTH